VSVLLEKTAEYERAGIPIDRLFRVFLASARTVPESLEVTIRLPKGLRADWTTRVAVVPPFGSRNVFFRLRGTLQPGSDSIFATAGAAGVRATVDAAPVGAARPFSLRAYNYGSITHEYPHIPSQQFIRSSKERVESVDLRVPPRLRVAYVKGSDDVQGPLGQLQLDVHALEPSLLSVVDLSLYSTILIGAGALANDALVPAVPSLVEFMRGGGAVVVLSNDKGVATSGLLPFSVAFDSVANDISDPDAAIHVTDPASQLLTWPNVITAADFGGWSGGRARNIPSTFDRRFRTVLSVGKPGETQTDATLLTASVGKGLIVYTSLSLDRELNAAHAGGARLFVNLLSAGMHRTTTTR